MSNPWRFGGDYVSGLINPLISVQRPSARAGYEPIDPDCEFCKDYWTGNTPDVVMRPVKVAHGEDEDDVVREGEEIGVEAGPDVGVKDPARGPKTVSIVSRLRDRESKGELWHSTHPFKTDTKGFRAYNPTMDSTSRRQPFESWREAHKYAIPPYTKNPSEVPFEFYNYKHVYAKEPSDPPPGPRDEDRVARHQHHWEHIEQYARRERNMKRFEDEVKEQQQNRAEFVRERAALEAERAAAEAAADPELARHRALSRAQDLAEHVYKAGLAKGPTMSDLLARSGVKRPPEGKGKPSSYRDIVEGMY